jgi:Domain of unknown function (DUF5666)
VEEGESSSTAKPSNIRRALLRKPIPLTVLLALCGLLALPCFSVAHALAAQEDGQNDEAAGIVQLFGEGNGLRGTVTAAQPGNFMVRTDEGESYKVFWSPNTHFMKDRQPIEANAVRVGDMLLAAGDVDRKAKTVGAVFLYDVDANQVRKARAGFGKTWTAGKVTAIHDLRITIEQAGDLKAEVVAVDENTSFRRQKESVTLADVKVGDFISVQGAVRDNVFLASVLRLVDPNSGPNSRLSGGAPSDF